jgi:MerR family regulatory protein
MREITITAAAREAGVRTSTLRYYERIGLLSSVRRVAGRQRSTARSSVACLHGNDRSPVLVDRRGDWSREVRSSKLAKRKDKTAIRVSGPYRSVLETEKVRGPVQCGNPERIQAFLPWNKSFDYAIARMNGVDPVPIPSWIKGTHRPQLANLLKIERFPEKVRP